MKKNSGKQPINCGKIWMLLHTSVLLQRKLEDIATHGVAISIISLAEI